VKNGAEQQQQQCVSRQQRDRGGGRAHGGGRAAAVVSAVDSTGRAAYLTPIQNALSVSIEAGYAEFLTQKRLVSTRFYRQHSLRRFCVFLL
jgi:hypothetical protein